MTNTEMLKDEIRLSGLKISFIAEKMGISRASLYEKINNKSPFNQFEIEAICRILGITSSYKLKQIFFER